MMASSGPFGIRLVISLWSPRASHLRHLCCGAMMLPVKDNSKLQFTKMHCACASHSSQSPHERGIHFLYRRRIQSNHLQDRKSMRILSHMHSNHKVILIIQILLFRETFALHILTVPGYPYQFPTTPRYYFCRTLD